MSLTCHGAVLAVSAALLAGCTPLHRWDAHTTSMPGPLDVAELTRERVAMLGVLTPAALQGSSLSVSHALLNALSAATPSVRVISARETANMLNEQGLAAEYAALISGFAGSGILEGNRLKKIGAALRSHYVLLPGFGNFNEVLVDHFEITGLKVVRRRVTSLRLWLQLWDTQTGRMLWESTGEATAASEVMRPARTVPLEEIAWKLRPRMLREGLLGERTGAGQRMFR